jgi:hypothetical protein
MGRSRSTWFAKTQAATVPQLDARTKAVLGQELDRLTPEGRGYITKTEAARLFSTSDKFKTGGRQKVR